MSTVVEVPTWAFAMLLFPWALWLAVALLRWRDRLRENRRARTVANEPSSQPGGWSRTNWG